MTYHMAVRWARDYIQASEYASLLNLYALDELETCVAGSGNAWDKAEYICIRYRPEDADNQEIPYLFTPIVSTEELIEVIRHNPGRLWDNFLLYEIRTKKFFKPKVNVTLTEHDPE